MKSAWVTLLLLNSFAYLHAQSFSLDSLATVAITPATFSASFWGDYDGDGYLDFILCGRDTSNQLFSSLFQNDGAGAFTEIAAGLVPVELGATAWADYDNDGDLDLLITGREAGSQKNARIYRNDAGQFTDIAAPLAGVSRAAAAWGDYDNDGRTDLLLMGKDDAGTAVSKLYHNDGSDAFSESGFALEGLHSGTAVWFDFDSDGRLDLLLTGADNTDLPVTKIYRNTASGFTVTDLAGFANSSAAVGDFDQDGDADIVLTGVTVDSLTSAKIYLNDGAGNFTDANVQLDGLHSGSAHLADIDNDGDLDILFTGADTGGSASSLIHRNDGPNVFTRLDLGLAGATDGFGNFADLNNDGDLDILLTGTDSSGVATVRIYANTALVPNSAPTPPTGLTSTLTRTALILAWKEGTDSETTGGLTSNLRIGTTPGGEDILSSAATASGARQIVKFGNMGFNTSWTIPIDEVRPLHAVYWSVQSIDNGFVGSAFAGQTFVPDFTVDTLASSAISGVNASSIDWGDFDNDGDLDLLLTGQDISNDRIALIYRNDGGSKFMALDVGFDGVAAGEATWGDFDNDGDLDLALTGFNSANLEVARIYRNNGDDSFSDIGADLTGVFLSAVDWGDFDNDGDLDLLYAGTAAGVSTTLVYRNDDGVFTSLATNLIGVSDGTVAWGDFDNDGWLDILLVGSSQTEGSISRIYANDGFGTFTETAAALPGVASGNAALGDYDNDGDTDILIAGSSTGGRLARILRNDGNFAFVEIDVGITGVSNGSIAFGDYDNDGALDILLAGFDAQFNRVAMVYHNAGNDVFSNINAFLEGVIFGDVGWVDYDADNDLDILLTGSSLTSRVASIYRNNVAAPGTPPQPPLGLTASFTDTSLTFNWQAGTLPAGLTSNLRVGTTPGASDILTAMSLNDGYRQIVKSGNTGHLSTAKVKISDILSYPSVYWSVQVIDNAFRGSDFADEASFAAQIISIADVPNDEGGKVTVKWRASSLDHDVNRLTSYSVWRAIPATQLASHGEIALGHATAGLERGGDSRFRLTVMSGKTYAWEWLATLPAARRPLYSYTAETLFDSMATTSGKHFFLVSAHTDDANIFFDSLPDSGFAVDNLPPAAPANLTGEFVDQTLTLRWQQNSEPDFMQYIIFRDLGRDADVYQSEAFASVHDTVFVRANMDLSAGNYFVVVAQDSSGNLSKPSNEIDFVITAVERTLENIPTSFALFQNYPNPFNPTTQIRFSLPEDGHVTLEIFDLMGRRVETLLDRKFQAGFHSVTFDASRLPTATYFYKVQAGGFVEIKKMVLIR